MLAYMDFPAQHRVKIHSTNPIERLNKEVKRRADIVGAELTPPSIDAVPTEIATIAA